MKFSSVEQSTRNLVETCNFVVFVGRVRRKASWCCDYIGWLSCALNFPLRYMWLACDVRWHWFCTVNKKLFLCLNALCWSLNHEVCPCSRHWRRACWIEAALRRILVQKNYMAVLRKCIGDLTIWWCQNSHWLRTQVCGGQCLIMRWSDARPNVIGRVLVLLAGTCSLAREWLCLAHSYDQDTFNVFIW